MPKPKTQTHVATGVFLNGETIPLTQILAEPDAVTRRKYAVALAIWVGSMDRHYDLQMRWHRRLWRWITQDQRPVLRGYEMLELLYHQVNLPKGADA